MGHVSNDLLDVYNTYFQRPYHIAKSDSNNKEIAINYSIPNEWKGMASDNGAIMEDYSKHGIKINEIRNLPGHPSGIEVYLPVELTNAKGDYKLKIDCATIRVTFKNTIIRTALSERQGTVKRQFNTGDYIFTIKGVLIDKDRKLPETDILKLIKMSKNESPIYLNNAYAELFMTGENRIAIESLEFPEQEGKHIRHRPFVMVCETDFINKLVLK
ncbi:MAG: DUF6046 domain-containing protein [Paludibacter sp.]|nr:DUF6046 domain-containing protein [Paludibacter sp.]